MTSPDIRKSIVELSTRYNSSLKYLGRIYSLKKKGTFDEEKAHRNNMRLALIISEDPLWLMEKTGPFFMKYAPLIHARDWAAFINLDFGEEKHAYKSTSDGADKSNDKMEGHIRFLKHLWLTSTEKEQTAIGNIFVSILSTYCEFVLVAKSQPFI